MAVKPSLTSSPTPQLCKKACKACGLDVYQAPVFDHLQRSQIFWVGLSAVLFAEGDERLPLSPLTATGTLVHSIETPYRKKYSFYKTNLVKCVPLNQEKIRYPSVFEMEKCYPNFLWELEMMRPSSVFLLGKQVADFVSRKMGVPQIKLNDAFKYESFSYGVTQFIPIHHPSYILVYKRKQLQQYMNGVRAVIRQTSVQKRQLASLACA